MALDLMTLTIGDLGQMLEAGEVTAHDLTQAYLERILEIDGAGPQLRSVLEVNPEALEIASALDRDQSLGGRRGPLHGIPVLIKDNLDTADRMQTTAGSLALIGSRPAQDAFVAHRLRQAGAVLIGKTNLSEWANFRSTHSSSGWSGRGGQCLNPYVLDRSPCGSSSGSGASIAAGLAAAAIGTETDGSILCPSGANSLVGIKPTVGLVSRAGIIPIAHSQDSAGPMTRCVADAAAVLTAIAGTNPRDPATAEADQHATDYTRFLDQDGLRGARIGIPRERFFGYSPKADAIAEQAIAIMRDLGAIIVDPADIPTAKEMAQSRFEFEVLLYEFKADLNAYLEGLDESPVRSLADIIRFNSEHAAEEMPYFGQEILLMAEEKGPLSDPAYREALATSHRLSRQEGIDRVMEEHNLDALVAPTGGPTHKIDLVNGDAHVGGFSQPAAMAGYPIITVPAGFTFDLPVGIAFTGRAWSEPTLFRLAYAFEQASRATQPPRFLPPRAL